MLYSDYQQGKILSKYYSLEFVQNSDHTSLKMDLNIPYFMTGSFPHTLDYLGKTLPSIFTSQCYNYDNSPFHIEAQNTEIAHLFEHILIAYLYNEKSKENADFIKIDGITKWKTSSNFSYNITISTDEKDSYIFSIALKKSVRLLNKIITAKQAGDLPVLF